jgi:hypothetical protein
MGSRSNAATTDSASIAPNIADSTQSPELSVQAYHGYADAYLETLLVKLEEKAEVKADLDVEFSVSFRLSFRLFSALDNGVC